MTAEFSEDAEIQKENSEFQMELLDVLRSINRNLEERNRKIDICISALRSIDKNFEEQNKEITVYTSGELAELLKTNVKKVDILRQSGLLKGIKPGKNWCYRSDSVKEFLEQCNGMDLSSDDKRQAAFVSIKNREIEKKGTKK